MTTALLYRPAERGRIPGAFAAAIVLHLAAVALANREAEPPIAPANDCWAELALIDAAIEPPLVAPAEQVPAPPAQPTMDEPVFGEDTTPVKFLRERKTQPLVRPTDRITAPILRGHAGRAFALNAPRPEYPYEARRQRLTGSGIALLTIDRASGAVLNVQMSRSTGSPVLDSAAINAFRRWRFKPGTAAAVQTPITFTLAGATY
jgi:TonB family protein